ncbi:MAG: hypothetical protein KKI09_09580 [Spirochaetes bacterium]|nr:hypothetical protein [Spirochaetota bacterium]MBU0955665.1 hypothetical protein [Spirochaetota bacterium]
MKKYLLVCFIFWLAILLVQAQSTADQKSGPVWFLAADAGLSSLVFYDIPESPLSRVQTALQLGLAFPAGTAWSAYTELIGMVSLPAAGIGQISRVAGGAGVSKRFRVLPVMDIGLGLSGGVSWLWYDQVPLLSVYARMPLALSLRLSTAVSLRLSGGLEMWVFGPDTDTLMYSRFFCLGIQYTL